MARAGRSLAEKEEKRLTLRAHDEREREAALAARTPEQVERDRRKAARALSERIARERAQIITRQKAATHLEEALAVVQGRIATLQQTEVFDRRMANLTEQGEKFEEQRDAALAGIRTNLENIERLTAERDAL